ncbi:MAG TPA: DNA recombination protein RmuC [Thermosynergistes sp.]|nr:MAG: Uncharacterized protein XD68_0426 [Synergistales bacterium 54_24]HAF50890.1 DNA recombination protein RmuC [Synergistaceae bacterium]HPZ76761.1 DNA recombination protein RmuC [Thermosynergistes sp.]HXK89396.1 DNA recombination protein RmuC [Thermosynergistes sp.]
MAGTSLSFAVFAFVVGFLLGLAVALLLSAFRAKANRRVEEEREELLESITNSLKESFGSLSMEALSRSTEEFLKLAKVKLESEREATTGELEKKKELIDKQLQAMSARLETVSNMLQGLEKERASQLGELASQIKGVSEQAAALGKVASALREALASAKTRGQWGERMAEDVLRLIGFVENVNYYKQKSIDGSGARPDFTFPLPKGAVLNMDVKFPFDNYLRYLEVEDESQKALFRTAFLRDVRSKIKEVATRGYINQEQNTLDFALLFIPNEQIYSFIQECDGSILDEALQNKVIFCSPTTLYAVLSVIRKAADDFALERTSGEILKLLGTFRVQWEKFLERLNHLGKQIEGAYKDYEELATTRKRQLEKPLDAIEALKRKNLPSGQEGEEGVAEGLDDLSNDTNIQIEKCDAPRDTRR